MKTYSEFLPVFFFHSVILVEIFEHWTFKECMSIHVWSRARSNTFYSTNKKTVSQILKKTAPGIATQYIIQSLHVPQKSDVLKEGTSRMLLNDELCIKAIFWFEPQHTEMTFWNQ